MIGEVKGLFQYLKEKKSVKQYFLKEKKITVCLSEAHEKSINPIACCTSVTTPWVELLSILNSG